MSGATRVPGPTFATRMTEAFHYPVRDPLKMLAAAVILRWVEDGATDEIGEEWAEHADVPTWWFKQVEANA